jgi:hypothetical protein
MRSIFLALLMCGLSFARASGLEDTHDIDIVRISNATGQLSLYFVLDPQQLPQNPAVLSKVRRKLDVYKRYVTSGQVWKDEARANRELPVVLQVVVTGEMSSESRLALESLKQEYELAPTTFHYEHTPYGKGR